MYFCIPNTETACIPYYIIFYTNGNLITGLVCLLSQRWCRLGFDQLRSRQVYRWSLSDHADICTASEVVYSIYIYTPVYICRLQVYVCIMHLEYELGKCLVLCEKLCGGGPTTNEDIITLNYTHTHLYLYLYLYLPLPRTRTRTHTHTRARTFIIFVLRHPALCIKLSRN